MEREKLKIYTNTEFPGIWPVGTAAVVVAESPEQASDMGIKNCDLSDTSRWAVVRVKKHEEVIEGEHWTEYGFNYKGE